MQGLVRRLTLRVKAAVRTAAFTAFAVLFCLVGTGFLTAGLWQWVAMNYGPLTASIAVGAGYLGAGVAVLLVSPAGRPPDLQARNPRSGAATPAETEPFFQMAQGFAAGMQAGRAARQRRA